MATFMFVNKGRQHFDDHRGNWTVYSALPIEQTRKSENARGQARPCYVTKGFCLRGTDGHLQSISCRAKPQSSTKTCNFATAPCI